MTKVAIVTDTTADLPAGEPDVEVVPARVAFADRYFTDAEITPAEFFRRMSETGEVPMASSPSEDDFLAAFERALQAGGPVLCLVTPLDLIPSFTAANAAAVDLRGSPVQVVNPGVASAGLGSLVLALLGAVRAGADRDRVVDLIDELAPRCDTLFVPASLDWLERNGRLAEVEQRLGPLEETAVVRARTRITGVAAAASTSEGYDRLVEEVGRRAGEDCPLIAVVSHAANPTGAASVADRLESRWKIDRLVVSALSPTFGSQFGPGSVGVGVAPSVQM